MQLAVPHVSQNNLQFRNQCGQACVTMLVRAFGIGRPTVERAARRSGTWDKTTSSIAEMLVIGAANNLTLDYAAGGSLAWHRAQIAAGVPTIALIDRAKLVGGGLLPHFVVVTGIDERYVTLNDPLQSRGSYRTLATRFDAAINATVPGYYSTPRLALYPVARRLPVADRHDLAAYLVERLRAQAAQFAEMIQ